jgi:hypothetical protein
MKRFEILGKLTLAYEHILAGRKTVVAFARDFKTRVKITRQFKRSTENLVVTIGRLNYEERQFVKLCKKHGTKPRELWFPRG